MATQDPAASQNDGGWSPSPPPALALTAVQRIRTNDGGATWTVLNPTPGKLESRSWHLLLGVDPADGNHVFVNDSYSLYESLDGGNTWSRADAGIGYLKGINSFDWVNLTFDANGEAALTADQGVLGYDPATKSWTSLMRDLQVSEFYTVSLAAICGRRLRSGAGYFFGEVHWTDRMECDGGGDQRDWQDYC